MTRLPPALMPWWPLAKRVHRAAAVAGGSVGRRLDPDHPRAVPHEAPARSLDTARLEPDHVSVTATSVAPSRLVRDRPAGDPGGLRFWDEVRVVESDPFVLEVRDGRLVGESAATITPEGRLDLQTSPYFGIHGWREHPVYLRPRLPEPEVVDGEVLSLASHASARNYYHSIMDALPRWALYRDLFPGRVPDVVVVGHTARWDTQLVELAGIEAGRLVQPSAALSLRARHLVVPSVDNHSTLAPRWITSWLRDNLPAKDTSGRPRRIYVTRGSRPNTRRYEQEQELLQALEPRGFSMIDPGALTVQEQIDHFAAAEVVVAPHGAALVNLNFSPAGVRVLELFAPRYLNPVYWAITSNVPESRYRYVVGGTVEPDRPLRRMQDVQGDVSIPVDRVLAALDDLLSDHPGGSSQPHPAASSDGRGSLDSSGDI